MDRNLRTGLTLLLLFTAVLVLFVDRACPDDLTRDVAILGLAAGADLASTHYALGRCPSCVEANPIAREPAVHLLTKAAVITGTTATCESLRKGGHRGWARALRWTVAGVWVGVAGSNLHQKRR